MYDSTKIKLKRTLRWLKNIPSTQVGEIPQSNIQEKEIEFGEPIFVDNNGTIADLSKKCNSYLVIGSPIANKNDRKVKNAAIFKGFWSSDKAGKLAFYKDDERTGIIDEEGYAIYADKLTTTNVDFGNPTSNRYYILCQPDINKSSGNSNHGDVNTFKIPSGTGDIGIYINNKGIIHGAAWNDYAEKRTIKTNAYPGTVVCEVGDGSLVTSSKRLQPCPYVVTDTYGFVIGEDKDTPVAVAGRALVHLNTDDRCNVSIGDCLCAGEFGKASIMTREEIKEYPDRILGIVTGIPIEDKWNGVDINNRVWIKIK